jgi:hypothetical protein
MLNRPLHHVRENAHSAVPYIALLVAIGGGGGYALAASNSKTIHGCVNSRTHALYVQKRCQRGHSELVWNQRGPQGPAGTPVAQAFGVVNYDGTVSLFQSQGISAQHVGTGVYDVAITSAACAKRANAPTITVTQGGSPSVIPPPAESAPVGWIQDTALDQQFIVHTGYVADGTFSAYDFRFDIEDAC